MFYTYFQVRTPSHVVQNKTKKALTLYLNKIYKCIFRTSNAFSK